MIGFDAPIPGQSLTAEPRNHPWERPPEIVDPEEALQMHLTRLSEPKMLRTALDLMETEDLDIKTLVTGRLRGAVSQGAHTIDVSLIIAPVLHEFLKQAAKAAGIEADDGFEDKAAEEAFKKARAASLLSKQFEKMGGATPKKAVEAMEKSEEGGTTEPMPAAPAEPPRKGLMARGDI
jgi:hypothetical protein